ncbi:MAG: sialidase family protein, partial [Lachnospiraceae bacterium]
MRRTSKRLLALILALAMLAGTGSTFVGGNVYAAEVTGQTISGNELTNEPLEETTEEAVTEGAAEEVTEEAVEETMADEEEEADDTLSGNDAADTLSGNETDRKIQTVSQVKNTDRGVKIPGFTRIKGNTPLDPDKYYLIVTEDSVGKVYALYGNQSGFRNNGVLPRGENERHMAGQMAAELTINDNDVTATWLNNPGKSISVNDLRFTVSPMDNGYSFRSAEGHYLDMRTQVFGNHSVKLTVSPDYDGIGDGEGYLIKNGNRYIYFVAYGDTEKGGNFSGYWTDFWAPSGRMFDYFYTIALYEQDEERVTLDLTELEDMLDEAETAYPAQDDDTNKTKFTGITWIPFKRAREAAREVVGNPTASELTQEDVEDLEWNLRNTMKALAERRVNIEAEEYEYVLDTNGIDAGAKYVLYCGFGTGPRVISMNRDNGDAALTAGVRVSGNKLILDTSTRSEESQVWEAVDVGGDKFALKSTYGTTVGYFDLNRYGQNNVLLSNTPSELTITHTGGGGYGLTGAKSPYYNLTWLDDLGRGWIYARYPNIHRTSVSFYKQTPVTSGGSQSLNIEDPAPPEGVTQSEQPFTDDIKGSTNFGSPSLTTFGDGKVAAAATIQWNSTNNYGGSDVVVSVFSNDEWRFTTPLYFNDTADTYVEQGASFSDPMLAANGEKLYLLANLFPGGAGKVTGRTGGDAPWSPQQASGYVEIDGEQRLVLYYTAITNQQNNSNYQYYIGDFNEEFDGKVYAPVYERLDEATYADTPSYYVDREYYLYEVVDSNPKPMYCKQRAGSGATQKWVQQNVFFFESLLHVRCTNYLVLTTSENGGENWSEFTILTPEVKSSSETFYGTSSGGQGIVMGDGNLVVFPCYSWGNTSGGNSYASFIYSDDGGGTWKRSPNTMTWTGANETGVVKLADDRLRVFIGNGNTQLKYVDYTWNGQEWSVGGVIILTPNVHTTANRQVSAITYQLNDKTVIMISASRSNNSDGKIFTFELSDDAEKTMTLVDTYDMNPNQSNDYFAHSALIGHLSEAEGDSLSVLYESQSSPKKITYTTIHIGDILGNSYFQTKITGEIENRVYDGKRVEINELVKGLEVGKVPQDRTGNHTWEVYADEAGTNKLTEMPKDVGTYWVRARVEADSKYKENISNAIPFTIEQRPLTIRYVVVSDEAGNSLSGNSLSGNSLSGNTLVAHGVKEVYFEGLAEPEALTIEQDYTAVLAYNDENMDAANELEVTVALKNSALGKNYVLTSPTYTFEAEGHDDLWVSTVWSKEYTGSKVTQSFTLVDGNTLLKEGVDYTVSYKNNVNASEWELPKSDSESKEPKMVVESGDKAGVQLMSLGGTVDPSEIKDPSFNAKKAPQMIIKMKGNYTGTYTIYYQIEKISFTDNEDIAADDLTVTYTGKNQTPIPVVTWKGKKLVNNKDFYVKEYIAQKADKTAFTGKANEKTEIKLTLVGKGNYTGEKEIKLIIGKKDPNLEEVSMSKVTVKGMKTLIWDQAAAAAPEGMTQEALSVTYKKKGLIYQAVTASTQEPAEQPKTEYTIRYENNTAVGTATLVLEG